ncbi:MAG: tRNA pseudouridine(38-40) synthase TruA [Microthrixaceae bacterium]
MSEPVAHTPGQRRPGHHDAVDDSGSKEESRQRVRLLLAYDGTSFAGFAPNRGVRTVGGLLAERLERIAGHPVPLTCAGRTDKGVHAWGQVVTFDLYGGLDPLRLRRSLDAVAPGEIIVRDLGVVARSFDARFDATWRRYRYTIATPGTESPFDRRFVWSVGASLDTAAMHRAARALVGSHDFASFCRRPTPRPGSPTPSLVRSVHDIGICRERFPNGPPRLVLTIRAAAFCHQMVRSITALLVEVGRGRIDPDDVVAIREARDRNAAPSPAPPHGLCLHDVGYDPLPHSRGPDRRDERCLRAPDAPA